MNRVSTLFLLAIGLAMIGDIATAAPPELNLVLPPHFTRGKPMMVQVQGQNLGPGTQLVLPFACSVQENAASTGSASFVVTPAADVPLGVHAIRLRTAEGISNLRLVAVSDLPVVVEREPNEREEQAQPIELPVVLAGSLDHPARDTEVFRFAAAAGERLTLVTETRQLGLSPDLRLSLLDARRRVLATAEGTPGLFEDERIDHTFAESGEYFVKIHDADFTNVGWTNLYTLKTGALNYARTVFPLGGRRGESLRVAVFDRDGKATAIETQVPADPYIDYWRLPLNGCPGSLPWPMAAGEYAEVLEDELSMSDTSLGERVIANWPITVNGRIGQPEEQDRFRLAVQPGQKIRVVVDAFYLGSSLDGHLLIYDPIGKKLLAQNNDMHLRGNVDPGVWFEVPEGVSAVVVALRDLFSRGGQEFAYRMTIETGGPDFLLALGHENFRSLNDKSRLYDTADTLNLRVGTIAKFPISVSRGPEQSPYHHGPMQGFQGPITVRAVDVPAGITVESMTIPADMCEGELEIVAEPGAPRVPFALTIVGEATRDDGTKIRHVAERRLFLCEPAFGNMKWNHVSRRITCVVLDRMWASQEIAK